MPNTFAYIVLFSWPLVAWLLFRNLPVPKALVWTILAGYLLLPAEAALDLPMLPTLSKASIPSLAAVFLSLLYARSVRHGTASAGYRGFQPSRPCLGESMSPNHGHDLVARAQSETWYYLAILVMLLGPFLTVLQNREPVIAGPRFIPGLRAYDALSMSINTLIMLVPFLLGRRFLSTPGAIRIALKVFVIAAVAYSFLALFEVRMSPQLNNWVYGFFPHAWIQHLRGGGFRPIVFLDHGLALGLFLCVAIVASSSLWRDARETGAATLPWKSAVAWLALVLVLSKNGGATALALLFAPVAAFGSRRFTVAVVAALAVAVLTYPMLRAADWAPTELVYEIANSISEDRGGSLRFRLDNEEILLARANEKPLAGWGGWGRNRVYHAEQGWDLSVTDGLWIIRIGISGWLGYISMFGLLTLPTILVWSKVRTARIDQPTIGLMLVLTVALVDSIPNAFFGPMYWLVAGAVAGRYFELRSGTGGHLVGQSSQRA